VIVTLAGHVDHGKTSLVRALTGIDTDSLAEEKRRGLTIDIGFAYADVGGQRVGFVDVPGHQRFIHNMVAGVAAHQYALIVVAADDGPMPQTEEHLAILHLLGITDGVLAITKIDRVDAARVAVVERSAAELVAKAGLHLDAAVPTSTVSGSGIDQLRSCIAAAAQSHETTAAAHAFRLAIDRAFVIKGSGVVVTGTVHSGTLAQGDEVTIAPRGVAARARMLRVSDRPAERAAASDRCAVNLAGISLEQVSRGDWLVAPDTLAPTHNVILQLTVLEDFPRAVKHWLPVHVYHATSHAEGHVALLDSPPLAAGQTGLVELVLTTPLHPKHGDRLVLRDHALERTIGGGAVVDIGAPDKARRAPPRLARLRIQRNPAAATAFAELLDVGDVDVDAFKRGRNLTDAEFGEVLTAVNPHQLQHGGRAYAVPRQRWQASLDTLATQIAAYHKAAPHSPGLKADQMKRLALVPKPWLEPALAELVSTGRVRESGGHFFAPGHRPQLPPEDAALLKRIEALIGGSEQPPSSGDMAKTLGVSLRTIDAFVIRMAKLGLLVRIGANRVLLRDRVETFAELAQQLAAKHTAGFSARDFRDAAGIGRNLTIDVLEYFDHCGFTRRYGDLRRIVGTRSTLQRA
jgi:selenocysteine-specific elongation factor